MDVGVRNMERDWKINNLTTLEIRTTRADILRVYKIMMGIENKGEGGTP